MLHFYLLKTNRKVDLFYVKSTFIKIKEIKVFVVKLPWENMETFSMLPQPGSCILNVPRDTKFETQTLRETRPSISLQF